MEIKNLKKAGQRIIKAVKFKEKIILYGDSDLDGITSVIIIKETIENLGGKIETVCLAFREQGYGLNKNALKFLKDRAPALLICFDLGISNFKEMKQAKKYGFDTIIIDHHEILKELPKADIIVDPKQKGDSSHFEYLATAGIAFKLSKEVLPKKLFEKQEKSFLELAALGTISDLMPHIDENKEIIKKGVESLKSSKRAGIKVFFEKDFIKDSKSDLETTSKIISFLDAGQRKNNLTETYLILSAFKLSEARKILALLFKKNKERKLKIKEIVSEVEKRISKKREEPIIFEGKNDWTLVYLGNVASKICKKYKKPVFLFKKKENIFLGSVRNPKNINGVTALTSCSIFLKTYGGHPQASGFSLAQENLEKFKNCLIKYFIKHYD